MSKALYLISGPSGSGKTSLTQALIKRVPHLSKIATVTTRLPRPGEVDGVDYHFVSKQRFRDMEATCRLIETDFAFGEYYGLPFAGLHTAGDLAAIVTVEGARSLRRMLYNTHSIFILPSDAASAATRVVERAAPNEQARLAAYESEVLAARESDSVILNLDFEQSLNLLVEKVEAHRKMLRRGVDSRLHKASTAA